MEFVYTGLPTRVVFGSGKVSEVKNEVERLGLKKILILSTPQQVHLAQDIAARVGEIAKGIYDKAVMHVPAETVSDVMEQVEGLEIDACIAIGGGSTIGLAKAIALESGIPIIAIPTTYAGSEMTSVWGVTKDGIKTTGRDIRVLPKTVIYDPELSIGLPAYITATSGMNAIAHCVEGLYAEDANPVTSLMAEEGIRALSESLPLLAVNLSNIDAREKALYGAWLAGTVLGAVGMSIHHKLCHTLGGSFNLPHGEVHTVLIPHATHFNSEYAPTAMAAIGRALKVDAIEASAAIFDLIKSINGPTSLASLGMSENDLKKAAEIATKNPYYNPRPLSFEGVKAVLEDAYRGCRPTSH